jgi:hypothetical protein
VDVDVDYGTRHLLVKVDGQTSIDDPLLRACPVSPGNASLQVGLYCDAATQDREVNFDDLAFDAR